MEHIPNHAEAARKERLQDIGTAAAGIVHDLNNQLMLVMNFLDMEDKPRAMQALDACTALTNSILEWTRGTPTGFISTDLNAWLKGLSQGLSIPPGIELKLELRMLTSFVFADPLALSRAVHNIVTNAITAMNGSGQLLLCASPYEISIQDSGPGIPDEVRARIFEPFFTWRSQSSSGAGTGLGLAIVQDVMRQHGGSVTVHSEPGRGARFTLKFPRPDR